MKTFVVGLLSAFAVCVSLANSADAQSSKISQYAQVSGAQFFGRALPSGSIADQMALTKNIKGLQYCLSLQGKVVGNGECTALAEMHLAVSGAVPGNTKDRNNYIWGALPAGWAPGDVLQFEGCQFVWTEGNRRRTVTMEHHTAIVVSIKDSVVTLLHQNGPTATGPSGGPVVLEKVDFKGKQRGTVKGYRPVGG